MTTTPPDYPERPPAPDEPPRQVRCEVTGKLIDPEDAVEFRGKLVSAEGKNRLMEEMLGGWESPETRELRRPSFWRRFFCSILDGVALTIVLVVVNVLILNARTVQPDGYISRRDLNGVVFSYFLPFAYYAFMHYRFGKSLGKMAGGYRVANMDGTRVSGRTALVRAFWSDGLKLVLLGPTVLFWRTPDTILFVNGAISLFGLANCIVLVTDGAYQRALHDRFAGTRVVMDE